MRPFVTAAALLAAWVCCAASAGASAGSCSLTLPSTVSVGNYDPTRIATPTIVTFTLLYGCQTGASATNLTITAGPGAHAGGSFGTRSMSAGGSDRLNYWLYPPGFTVTAHSSANVWGDGSGLSNVWGPFSVTAGATAMSGTASIQIESNQDVSAGTYTDPVVFTMVFI
jgi:spore coat protein U-like protein